jgi:predicted ABC-type ATPase
MPELFIIAGCNGAGKTTAAYNLLPEVFQTVDFVNADEIARGINAADVNAAAFSAGKIMLQKINSLIETQTSFAFETTLSGSTYLKVIEKAKRHGFAVTLFFIYLEDYLLAKERVALRVSKGGHNIPAEIIERRYFKGIKNFKKYADVVDDWYLFDNSTSEYLLIAKSISSEMEILNFDVFNKITGL